MLGVNRELYETQVRAQATRNADDIAQFNARFRSDMHEYKKLFADLAKSLQTVQRCDTCADPWQNKKTLVDNLRKLNNRFGYILDRQLAIGNKNPDLISVSKTHIATKSDFDNHLDLLRANPQVSNDDKKKFDIELAKLDQTIRVDVAVAPKATPQSSSVGASQTTLQPNNNNSFVLDFDADEDIEPDDAMYTAEFGIYMQAETNMITAQLQLIDAEIKVKTADVAADVDEAMRVRDELKNTFDEKLQIWQKIRDITRLAEQKLRFAVIPRNVLEPHTDYMTDPPPLPNGAEHTSIQDQDEAKDLIQKTQATSAVVQSAQIQAGLDRIAELDATRHQNKNLGALDSETLEIQSLREKIRTWRAELLAHLRTVQFLFMDLLLFWNGSSSSQQDVGLGRQRFAVSDKDYLAFAVLFVQLLTMERQRFNMMTDALKYDMQKADAMYVLSRRRRENVPFDEAHDTKLKEIIESIRAHKDTIKKPNPQIWAALQRQVDTYKDKVGIDLRPVLFIKNRITEPTNVDVLKTFEEYKTKKEAFLRDQTSIEDRITKMEPKLEKLRKLQKQLKKKTTGALDFKPYDTALLDILQDRKQLVDLMEQNQRDAQSLMNYWQNQPRKVLEYKDNITDGHLITQYLIKDNEEMKANLKYYNAVAQGIFMRKRLEGNTMDAENTHIVKTNIRDMMQRLLEARRERDKWTKEKQSIQDDYMYQALLYGYEYKIPAFEITNLFSLDADVNALRKFQSTVTSDIEEQLKKERKALDKIVEVETEKGNMPPDQFQGEWKIVIDTFESNRAKRSFPDKIFDDTVEDVISADVCKSQLLLGSAENTLCMVLHCTSENTSKECKELFENGKQMLQDECQDPLQCEQALDVCENKDDCFQKLDKLRTQQARTKHHCAQFEPFPNMFQKCNDSDCVPESTSPVCTQLKANIQNAQKRIDSQVAAILNDIPQLSLPQQELQAIALAATQQRDARLHVIASSLNADLTNPKPKNLQDIGSYVNLRYKTLELMTSHTSPVLEQARKVWKLWIHDVVDVLQQQCKPAKWGCLAKAECIDECATLVSPNPPNP